jgi:glycosyltransferase involved in cell wall biosynthesis
METPWVPLWSSASHESPSDDDIQQLRAERGWSSDDFILMYSGNMGLGHLFDEVLEVATCSAENDHSTVSATARFVFYGMGKRRGEIERAKELHPESLIELHGYMDSSDLQAHLLSADVHLVSLRPEWDGVMVPSKLQGIFTVGRPVIFIGSEKCSIGSWILESGGGWVVQPNDVDALRQALNDARSKEERLRRGVAGRAYAENHFQRETNSLECATKLCALRN